MNFFSCLFFPYFYFTTFFGIYSRRSNSKISNSTLTKNFFEDIAYVKTAASGAMGNPGEIVLLDFAGNLYHGNWAYGDVDIDKLMRVFPAFKEINDGKEVEGWKYYYLGCGNSLMVNDKFRSAFEHQMGIDTGASVENRYWLDAALETLTNSTNNDDYYDDTIKI